MQWVYRRGWGRVVNGRTCSWSCSPPLLSVSAGVAQGLVPGVPHPHHHPSPISPRSLPGLTPCTDPLQYNMCTSAKTMTARSLSRPPPCRTRTLHFACSRRWKLAGHRALLCALHVCVGWVGGGCVDNGAKLFGRGGGRGGGRGERVTGQGGMMGQGRLMGQGGFSVCSCSLSAGLRWCGYWIGLFIHIIVFGVFDTVSSLTLFLRLSRMLSRVCRVSLILSRILTLSFLSSPYPRCRDIIRKGKEYTSLIRLKSLLTSRVF